MELGWARTFAACAALWAACNGAMAMADGDERPPSAEELTTLPLDEKIPGDLPKGGLRHWDEFKRLDVRGAYVSAVQRKAPEGVLFELWQNTWDGDDATEHRIVARRGSSLETLGAETAICDSSIIDDVFSPQEPGKLAPNRGITRLSVRYDEKEGYVAFCCVCYDYLPGTASLLPAILVSKTGAPESFRYLGKLKGEPAQEAAKRKVWSDGGTLLRLPDGRWRIYLNGYGKALSALEADALDGEWRFLRDSAGGVKEILPPRPPGVGCVFPEVLRSSSGWHLWLTDKWPPQSIWHFKSGDGLSWEPYGKQPEITRAKFNGHGIKCLKAYEDLESKRISGLLSVWTEGPSQESEPGWTLRKASLLDEGKGEKE